MATSIFDKLSQKMPTVGDPASNPLAPRAGGTQRLDSLINAGKQTNPSGLALDTEEEQGGLTEYQQGAKLVQAEGTMAGQRLKQNEEKQTQQFDFQAQDGEERRINSQLELANKSSDLLTKNIQNFKQLDLNKQKSIAQYSMSLARMSNQNYIEELGVAGDKQRLSSAIVFREALEAAVFKDEEELLRTDLTFKSLINAQARDFNDGLAEISIDQAIAMAATDNKAKSANVMYGGVGQVIQGGIRAGETYAKGQTVQNPNPEPDTQTTTGQGNTGNYV